MLTSISAEQRRARTLLTIDAPSKFSKSAEQLAATQFYSIPDRIFWRSGINPRERRLLLQRWSIELMLVVALVLLGRAYLGVMFFALAAVFEITLFRAKEGRRVASFERDYPTLLIYLATSIRTGQDPLVALCGAARTFNAGSVLAEEVTKFATAIEQGTPEDQAFLGFAESIRHPDLALFRTAMILSRKEGASLSTCLQRLARVTRQRQSFRRKVRSAVALQKISAYAIAACTLVIGLVQFSANPDVVRNAWSHPVGAKILQFGIFMIALGIIWMRRLVASRAS